MWFDFISVAGVELIHASILGPPETTHNTMSSERTHIRPLSPHRYLFSVSVSQQLCNNSQLMLAHMRCAFQCFLLLLDASWWWFINPTALAKKQAVAAVNGSNEF